MAERCGSTEPIQLLSLAPNETIELFYSLYLPYSVPFAFERHGDRWLFIVMTYDREVDRMTFYDPDVDAPNVVSSRIVSVDMTPLVDDTVVYSVRDPEHERTGVWIAQIGPIPEG